MMVSVLIGAGGCREEDELKVSTNPTNDNVCGEAAEVVCHNAFQCCVGEELESIFGVEITTTEKECRRDVELKCRQKYAKVFHSLESQRIALNLPRIKTCLTLALAPDDVCFPYESINQTADDVCDSVTEDMVQGLVAVDGACEFDYECSGEAICTEAQRCKKLLGAGLECSSDAQCLSALHCGLTDDFERVCMADVAVGGACAADNECVDGLYCNMAGVGMTPNTETDSDTAVTVPRPGVCAGTVANGEACSANYLSNTTTGNYTSDKECQSGNCLPGTCADGRGECETHADCAGTCSISGAECMVNNDCGTVCSGGYYDGSQCDEASDCPGTCSRTGTTCADATDCIAVCMSSEGIASSYTCTSSTECESLGAGYTCAIQTCDGAGACMAAETCGGVSTCIGRTCAAEYYVQNYCYQGWNWFSTSAGTNLNSLSD